MDRNLEKARRNYDSILGKYESSALKYRAAYYEYLTFFLVAITIGALTVHQILKIKTQ